MDIKTINALTEAFAAILATILLPALIQLLRALAAKLQAEIIAKQPDFQFDLGRAVDIAISAAEQMSRRENGIAKDQRLDYAISIVEKLLGRSGHDADLETIVAAIEARIYQTKPEPDSLETWRHGERACDCPECQKDTD